MFVQSRKLFPSYPDQLEPFIVFTSTAFDSSNFLHMLPKVEFQTFCKQVVEIDGSDPPGFRSPAHHTLSREKGLLDPNGFGGVGKTRMG
jgi:hypothetical protein